MGFHFTKQYFITKLTSKRTLKNVNIDLEENSLLVCKFYSRTNMKYVKIYNIRSRSGVGNWRIRHKLAANLDLKNNNKRPNYSSLKTKFLQVAN